MSKQPYNKISGKSTNSLISDTYQEMPGALAEEMTSQSIHGPMAVEFMTAQLIECVKQTHTHQIQISLTDSNDVWKVTVEKVSSKDLSARTARAA
jgi:DNA polymerase III sliding clamp (beta) subunit (PCNA family)